MNHDLPQAKVLHVTTPGVIPRLIPEGSFIKIRRPGERFWLRVHRVSNDQREISGTVVNDLHVTQRHGYKFGDRIRIRREEIKAWLPAEVM